MASPRSGCGDFRSDKREEGCPKADSTCHSRGTCWDPEDGYCYSNFTETLTNIPEEEETGFQRDLSEIPVLFLTLIKIGMGSDGLRWIYELSNQDMHVTATFACGPGQRRAMGH